MIEAEDPHVCLICAVLGEPAQMSSPVAGWPGRPVFGAHLLWKDRRHPPATTIGFLNPGRSSH